MNTSLQQPERTSEKKSERTTLDGSHMLLESLRRESVEVVFGYPGGAMLNVYDALYDGGISHILSRHEQGSIHAAEGYARVTGKPGVVLATSGPGATNLVTGLADAMMDSLPLVVFTAQVATTVIGSDAFQEASVVGITMPITKHNYQVRDVEQLPRTIKEAFHIATHGRPGPVLIDLPKDISAAEGKFDYDKPVQLRGYQPTTVPHRLQIRKLSNAIRQAQRPVILAGAGVLHAKASEELLQFAEFYGIPVVNTLLGLGAFPGGHSLWLGMGGMHGTYAANTALYEADLLINIGARFDDRLTGNLEHFAPQATVAHVDIDPSEIGKNVPTQIPIVGDAKESLSMLMEESVQIGDISVWRTKLQNLQEAYPFWYVEDGTGLKPQRVVELVHDISNGNGVVVTDVGQHQMWAAQFHPFRDPHKWVTSGGLGTMGFGLPAAVGAQIGLPNEPVFALLGDGGFQMTMQELSVLVDHNLPVKVVILNNAALGMVRQWQQLFYKERYSHSLIPKQPDFSKLAEAYGIPAFVVDSEEDAAAALQQSMKIGGPVLIDCRIAPMENVYPMIAPGKGLHEMVGVKP
ncbi:acetolactate synthase large subunit [Alicyclobacillus sp. SO9]|uniref:acetolactate synthase large subunit n=1 Tax=Alicyclobacillus sp. SO9 TaxID=2665646 RepID=UPI0018E8D9F7|nr:acetolactate synthase large subunit [Alicyclobacillus sp. SO9]QQE77676.1 acetolactate synthase large subunit [Alicyclobacillus sp. SO9]